MTGTPMATAFCTISIEMRLVRNRNPSPAVSCPLAWGMSARRSAEASRPVTRKRSYLPVR
jgi:hypothetical protein